MGILRDIFEEKVKIWEGSDEEVYESYCQQLKSTGMKIQAFTVNQRTPKCSGNCATCMAIQNEQEDEELGYKKLGRGCSDDLLNAKQDYEIYTIFVKKSEEQKALDLLGLEPFEGEAWPKTPSSCSTRNALKTQLK